MPRVRLLLIAVLIALTTQIGCTSQPLVFEPDGGTYDSESVRERAAALDEPSIHGADITHAEGLRHDALVALRSEGGSAIEAANLLTDQFPGERRSVPYYVEAGTFEGADAWIVVEVWGSEGGVLDQTRLWVFERGVDERGNARVLYTAAVN